MITFPVTPEAFIAYQEQLLGRKLTEKMREATTAWVEGFNLSYKDGLEQDAGALLDVLAGIDELTARRDNSPVVRDILQVCRRWLITAWKQGFHDAGRSSADGR